MFTRRLRFLTAILVVALSMGGIAGCDDSSTKADKTEKRDQTSVSALAKVDTLSEDEAASRVSDLLTSVQWSNSFVTWREKIEPGQKTDLKETLPDINEFNMVVEPQPAGDDVVVVEVFVSSEKSGTGTDGWMLEVARDFNNQDVRLGGGQTAKVSIRKIPSGTGYQFIASRKYLPQAFSPSNHLWVQMAAEHGVAVTPIRERMVGNIAGVVMKSAVADMLRSTYGSLDIKNLIDAVVQGRIVMGYTNPFSSSTGLNFLVTVLATFSDGDESRMLTPEVVSGFEGFQRGVPFVAMTTLQMRESVERGGSLDAFVMEHQTFLNTPALQSGYEFLPFGIKHDNPLYGVGNLTAEQREVLKRFADFADEAKYQKLAADYGFNSPLQYDPTIQLPAGDVLVQAQRLWKEKKDAGRPIAAVFLSDISGSMAGTRISGVKQALRAGSEFVASGNAIGLVLFDNKVKVVLPIKKFDLNQKAAFHAAIKDMDTAGGTHMYDGIAVSLDLLIKYQNDNPGVRPVLFVLTDGETKGGIDFDTLGPVIAGLKIPVYTIGYEANLAELRRLSSLVEAVSLNAAEADVTYKIGSLLNAQM